MKYKSAAEHAATAAEDALDALAFHLRAVGTAEAKLHADEATRAADIARGWRLALWRARKAEMDAPTEGTT